MLELIFFMKACLVGLAIAAPMGPVALLCIQRALTNGQKAALGVALGAALADTILGALGNLGAALSDDLLSLNTWWLKGIFGSIILAIGIRIYLSKPNVAMSDKVYLSHVNDFLSSFIVTLTNPAVLLAAIGIFSALSISTVDLGNYLYISLLLSGVFTGSFLWWVFLSGLAATLRDKFKVSWIDKINKGVGIFLILLGIGIAISALI